MTRTAALIVSSLALAVAACGPAPVAPYTNVTFYWQFQDMDGNVYGDWSVYSGCGSANVDQVRVTMSGPAGQWTQTVDCLAPDTFMPGAMFTNLPVGPYTWVLEGRRLDFTVYTATGSGDLVNFPVLHTTILADYPNMDLWYQLPLGQTCAGIAEIAFRLYNLDGGVVEYSSDNVIVACQPPPNNGFTMPSIPVGNYGYQFVSALNAPWPNGAAVYQVCGFGYPPQAPLVQTRPNGNAYTAQLGYAIGTCP